MLFLEPRDKRNRRYIQIGFDEEAEEEIDLQISGMKR